MTQPTSAPARSENNRCLHVAGILSLDMAVHAGVGAAVATVVTLNPAIGATFGALYFAGSHSINGLERWLESRVGGAFGSQTTLAKMMRLAIAFLSGITLATAACTFIGVPIVFSAGIALTAAMLATTATIGAFVFSHSFAKDAIMGPSAFSQWA